MNSLEHSSQKRREEVMKSVETSIWSRDSSIREEEAGESRSQIYRNSFRADDLAQVTHGQTTNHNRDNNFNLFYEPMRDILTTRLQTGALHSLSNQSDADITSEPSMSPLEPFPPFRNSIDTLPSMPSTPSVTSLSEPHSTPSMENKRPSHPKPKPQSYVPTNAKSAFVIPLEFEVLIYPTLAQGSAQFYDKPHIVPFLAGSIELCASIRYQDLLQEIRDKFNEFVACGKMPSLPIAVNQITLVSLKSDVTEDNAHHIFAMMRRREGSETLVATIKPANSWEDDIGFERVKSTIVNARELGDGKTDRLGKERRSSI